MTIECLKKPKGKFTIFCYALLFSLAIYSVGIHDFFQFKNVKVSSIIEEIDNNCSCQNEPTGNVVDFCYKSPQNRSLLGKKFDCSFQNQLDYLELLFPSAAQLFDPNDLKNTKPTFVTAASVSYFPSLLVFISKWQKAMPKKARLVFFDLSIESEYGYSPINITELKICCNVLYRRFPYEKFPKVVLHLEEFRWKPLVIAEALKEFKAIWYLDTSIHVKNGSLLPKFNDLLTCNKLDLIDCSKQGYLLHAYSGHGLFAMTDPGVYNYIPSDLNRLKSAKVKMYDAGIAFILKTRWVVENVLKWYVLCALEPNCMSPQSSYLLYKSSCNLMADDRNFDKYSGCHRFDQSALNLLLVNANDFTENRFTTTDGFFDRFFSIHRHTYPNRDTLLAFCPKKRRRYERLL